MVSPSPFPLPPSSWLWGLLLVACLTAVHTFYWTDMRMRAPLMPVVALAAAGGLFCCRHGGWHVPEGVVNRQIYRAPPRPFRACHPTAGGPMSGDSPNTNSLQPWPPPQVLSFSSSKPRPRQKSKTCSGLATSNG